MSYKVAICDDSEIDRDYICNLFLSWSKKNQLLFKVDTFSSGEEFLFKCGEHVDYDILLLDIEMKKVNGMELAKKIRNFNPLIQIVFISGYSDYIFQGYDVEALHYLLKPIDVDKFFWVLNKAMEKLLNNEKSLTFNYYGDLIRLPLHFIKYISVKQNYITIHANEDYTLKSSLTDYEELLDDRFLRVGRSLIVNLTLIIKVSKQSIYLKGGIVLPLPRGAYDKINKEIINRL